MATQNFEILRARVQALGYALYVTDKGEQLVIHHFRDSDRTPEVVFIHTDGGADDLEDWIADREQVSVRVRRSAGPSATANAHLALRRAAMRVIHQTAGRTLACETDGGYKPIPELVTALEETALDVEQDTAEVIKLGRRKGVNEEFAEAAGDRIDALDRPRSDAHIEVREISELIDAARTVDDDVSGDGRIRACLDVARRKLVQLVNDLDSVNFGRVAA